MQSGRKSSGVKRMSSSKKTDDESVVLDISDVAENGDIVESPSTAVQLDQDDSTILELPTIEHPAVTRAPSDAFSHETNASEGMESLSISYGAKNTVFQKRTPTGCKRGEAEETVASAGGTIDQSPVSPRGKSCNDPIGSADGAVAYSSRRHMNSSMDGKEFSSELDDSADTLLARLRGMYSRKPLQCLLFGIMVRQCCQCLPSPSPSPSIPTFLPLPVSYGAPSVLPSSSMPLRPSPSFSLPHPDSKFTSSQHLDALVQLTKSFNFLLSSCAPAAALLFGTGGGLGQLGIYPSREAG
jgi:hypothetical protein